MVRLKGTMGEGTSRSAERVMLLSLLLLLSGGCPSSESTESTTGDSELPSNAEASVEATSESGDESESESAGEHGSFLEDEPCESSDDCSEGHCVAAYDPGREPPHTDFICVAMCVPSSDRNLVCADDLACCESLTCNDLGQCIE